MPGNRLLPMQTKRTLNFSLPDNNLSSFSGIFSRALKGHIDANGINNLALDSKHIASALLVGSQPEGMGDERPNGPTCEVGRPARSPAAKYPGATTVTAGMNYARRTLRSASLNAIRVSATLVISLLLAACGGGADGEGNVAEKTTAVCTGSASVALLGDSTMLTDGSAGPAMVAVFDREFGAGRVKVTNLAVGGSVSGQLVAAFPSEKFDIVVDNHGINDCRLGVPVADYTANMRKLVDLGVNVIETQNPIATHDCGAYQNAAAKVAEEAGVPLIDTESFVSAMPDWKVNTPDGVHPNQGLYTKIATNRAAELLPKLRALVCR
jgi:lysophospholipase L1-like esterase